MNSVDVRELDQASLEQALDDFDPRVRGKAIKETARRLETAEIVVPPLRNEVNLHYHTFFSYNANGWSPSRVAWEARKHGLAAAGIVDFDVLDGMEEFLSASETLALRCSVALETRVFISEYLDHVISSPNEPGISYFMGAGCCQMPEAGTRAAQILTSMREMARRRNVEVMRRVNNYLDTVQIDYEADVVPLTPSGNATERHLLAAYDRKSREVYKDAYSLANFWAKALGISQHEAEALVGDTARFHETVRSKLMKHGGVGYVPPTAEGFPQIELVIEMIEGIHALPTATWLDGTNSGESDLPALLSLLIDKGVVAMNMIPERNWNIKDAEEKRLKTEKLAEAVAVAKEMALPLSVGTEMNKPGLPFVDNFSTPELQPFVEDFLAGAYFFWGHTLLARNLGMGYASQWSNAHFGTNRRARNEFYAKVGRAGDPATARAKLACIDAEYATPDEVIAAVSSS